MNKWVWIDLELTGLNIEKDKIIEISVIVTDSKCQNLIIGPSLVINVSADILDSMDDFVKKMHKKSKLMEEVKLSTLSLEDAENDVYQFLEAQEIHDSELAGNSIHMDRMFLLKNMPRLFEKHISLHRIIDVSSIKEIYTM